ncbi:uncharacterized protein LOC129763365 [Toxorhynchites rutilus septentrionalis]|uniref:uncharacterized protein LOC129763365 n=1 Tax=Toxorhynchites rutilus septentrionalis TaxID=329112 RepID=UPI00247971FE|nr:uncharacterized protein LOC129763365 [Toxorhynchites rutilus septentrionalis]
MPGSFKLYIPLLVLPPLVKQDGVTRSYLINHFLEYVYISIATYVQAALSLTFQCGFSNLFGYLNYWCVMFWPCLLGVALGPRLPPQHLRLQGITFFNMMVETMIRKSRPAIIQRLRTSKWFGTLSFMSLSAIIMTWLHSGHVKQFWLINPPSPQAGGSSEGQGPCHHKHGCIHHLLDGMLKYATIGLILESVRALITKSSLLMKNRSLFLGEFLSACNTKLGLFLAFYVGIYRATCCIQTRRQFPDSPRLSTVAGFLAGCAYWLYPKYQVFTLAFTKAIEISWEHWMKTGENLPPIVRRLNRLPFVFLAQMISFGYLGHIYAFHPHLSPSFHIKAMNFGSKNLTLNMRRTIMAWIVGHSP